LWANALKADFPFSISNFSFAIDGVVSREWQMKKDKWKI
jgi:hypothetical protein